MMINFFNIGCHWTWFCSSKLEKLKKCLSPVQDVPDGTATQPQLSHKLKWMEERRLVLSQLILPLIKENVSRVKCSVWHGHTRSVTQLGGCHQPHLNAEKHTRTDHDSGCLSSSCSRFALNLHVSKLTGTFQDELVSESNQRIKAEDKRQRGFE